MPPQCRNHTLPRLVSCPMYLVGLESLSGGVVIHMQILGERMRYGNVTYHKNTLQIEGRLIAAFTGAEPSRRSR